MYTSTPAPAKEHPSSASRAATPRISAAEVLRSSGRGSRSLRSTTIRGYPWDCTRIMPLWLGAAAARMSRSTAAANTRPC